MESLLKTADPPLLCESCGYHIASLPSGGSCPECGTPLASSLPAARTGSDWQNRPAPTTFFSTGWSTLRHPAALFSRLTVTYRGSISLLACNLALAAAVMAHPFVGVFYFDPARSVQGTYSPRALLITAASALTLIACSFLFLLTLSLIELVGIRFIAARRGWRLQPAAALQIIAHSSIAWFFAALFLNVGFAASSWIPTFSPVKNPQSFWDELLSLRAVLPNFAPVLGLGLGMLCFEWLVYRGMRICKFANSAPTLPSARH
jgi:hypothetical protein